MEVTSVLRRRFFYLYELKDLRWPVSLIYYCIHLAILFDVIGVLILSRLVLLRRQGSDGSWIESLDDQPNRHYHFLWRQHHLQI